MPWCNTDAMARHLAAIAGKVAPGQHAVLLLDRAGWHMSAHLVVPETAANASRFGDITIVPLPSKCPELNPQENVWQFMRDNWLSNRVFILREPGRSLLRCLEQARRSALDHYVDRTARLDARVLIKGICYESTPPHLRCEVRRRIARGIPEPANV